MSDDVDRPDLDPELQGRVRNLREGIPTVPALPQEVEDAWKQVPPEEDVIVPKVVLATIFTSIKDFTALIFEACEVSLSLSLHNKEEALDALERLAKGALRIEAKIDIATNMVASSTIAERKNGQE